MSCDSPGGSLALAVYRAAALGSAWILAASGSLDSVVARRSVGTGEVTFGRSDIDLTAVLKVGSGSGRRLARFSRHMRVLRALNPALGHVEVFRAAELEELARADTVWGSMSRQSFLPLWGKRIVVDESPIDPGHALAQFLLWTELFLGPAVHRRDSRNLLKHSLECWNFYAVARGLLNRPFVRRQDMRGHLKSEQGEIPSDLHTPGGATRFILGLAGTLHRELRPPMPTLGAVTLHQTVVAPHGRPRRYVILPTPETPLPAEVFQSGSFPVTPELLDLYLHFKNSLFYLDPPPLQLTEPAPRSYLRDILRFSMPHLLHYPGFIESGPNQVDPVIRIACLRHCFSCLRRGESPTPFYHGAPPGLADVRAYYTHTFDRLRALVVEFREEVQEAMREWRD